MMRLQKMMNSLMMAFSLTAAIASAENEKPAAPSSFDKIVLGSSGGFTGRGTGKALTVTERGNIEAKSGNKQKSGQLKAAEMDKLKQLVAAVDWEAVKESYNRGADTFTSNLSVTVGGKVRSTHISDPRPDEVPENLGALLDFLNQLHENHKP